MKRLSLAIVLVASLLPLRARAETERERAAREVDAEAKQMVKLPPAKLRVIWEGADSDKIAFDEARFELDDSTLGYGELDDLASRAKNGQPLYDGPIDEGKHNLLTTLVVHRTHVSLFEGLRKTTFKVTSAAGLPGQKGLAVTVKIKLHYDESQKDPKKRLSLETRVEPQMEVAVDATVPPELPHTVVAHAVETAVVEKQLPKPPEPEVASAEPKPAHAKHKVRIAKALAKQPALVKPAFEPQPVAVAEVEPGRDAGAAAFDAGPQDAGALAAAAVDAGPADAGALAAAALDAGAPETTVTEQRSYTLPIVGGLAVLVLVLGLGFLRTRKR